MLKNVVCCVPLSWAYVPSLFFRSWCDMQSYGQSMYHMSFVTTQSCYMDIMREELVVAAMKHMPDYILWLDADQTYPRETIEILMEHIDSGKVIVGGITPDKDDGTPLVYDIVYDNPSGLIKRRKVRPNGGVVKVDAMGFGGIMTHPSVFTTLLKPPFFDMKWDTRLKSRPGEDVQFYLKCKEAGIDVYCDTDLPYDHVVVRQIGHKR